MGLKPIIASFIVFLDFPNGRHLQSAPVNRKKNGHKKWTMH